VCRIYTLRLILFDLGGNLNARNKNNSNATGLLEKPVRELVAAFEDIPILMRLQYVSALLFNRACRDGNESKEQELMAAINIVDDVARVLETVPNIAKITSGPA
jgi:hypothetical protein